MSLKNKNAKPVKKVAKEITPAEIRVDIGEATFNIISKKTGQLQDLNNELEKLNKSIEDTKISINETVTASIEAAGHKIYEGIQIALDAENKQFIIK